MKNLNLNEVVFIGDNEGGVLVRVERRDGHVVFVQAAPCGFEATDASVLGKQAIREGETFTVEGERPVFMHMGYDEEEGYPLLGVAPRSMVG
jgi:hypothetical protein